MTINDINVLRDIIETQNAIAGQGMDLSAAIDTVAELALRLTGSDGALVQMVEGDQMVYRAACGIAAPQIGRRTQTADSLAGACVAQGKVLRSDDTRDDARVDGLASRRLGAVSVICTPIFHEDVVKGVLTVYRSEPGALTEVHEPTLALLGTIVSSWMSHGGACEQGRRAHREDTLTGLGNRRAYDERLAAEISRAARHERPLSLILIDVDEYVATADKHGGDAGDQMLLTLSSALRAVRGTDVAFRIGADQFALLLPETDVEGLPAVASRVRRHLDAANSASKLPVDVSFGGAQMRVADPIILHAEADVSLYAAKRRRGERVLHAA